MKKHLKYSKFLFKKNNFTCLFSTEIHYFKQKKGGGSEWETNKLKKKDNLKKGKFYSVQLF